MPSRPTARSWSARRLPAKLGLHFAAQALEPAPVDRSSSTTTPSGLRRSSCRARRSHSARRRSGSAARCGSRLVAHERLARHQVAQVLLEHRAMAHGVDAGLRLAEGGAIAHRENVRDARRCAASRSPATKPRSSSARPLIAQPRMRRRRRVAHSTSRTAAATVPEITTGPGSTAVDAHARPEVDAAPAQRALDAAREGWREAGALRIQRDLAAAMAQRHGELRAGRRRRRRSPRAETRRSRSSSRSNGFTGSACSPRPAPTCAIVRAGVERREVVVQLAGRRRASRACSPRRGRRCAPARSRRSARSRERGDVELALPRAGSGRRPRRAACRNRSAAGSGETSVMRAP